MKKQIEAFESKYKKKETPKFDIGDTVDVHFRIKEENKMRVQVFSGVVIGEKGPGVRKTFTVRRISYGEGVERVFPTHSPLVEKIVVRKRGKARRAKLYYLRGRKGKRATKVREKIVREEKSE
ncbi:MAG: 50S ribosomal protein L19 [Candidatus Makaraimicrobium thalassicum]|nr:MAG: 50S ribosomal protein L19 [Candidatus Omnitrophota bacterium]